jgi:Exo70 exocyst complex subunit
VFLGEVLKQMEASIDVNAKQYKAPVASLIFQLNNIHYIWTGIKSFDPSIVDPAIELHLQASITALIKSLLTKYSHALLSPHP